MNRADDGFGNLVPVNSPYGAMTKVYTRLDGMLAQFNVETADHVDAIAEVRRGLKDVKLTARRWRGGPVLAVITADEC